MSNEVTIYSMNEAIAEFMELEKEEEMYYTTGYRKIYLINGYWYPIRKLKYHTSWDWLMPIVQKIHSLAVAGDAINAITEEAIFTFSIFAPLKDVHAAVYQFITWYNQQKQTNDITGTNKG